MKIHPTAIVAEGAVITAGVEIGPYSIIGPEVKIGEGTVVQSHVVLESDVSIGRKNLIGHGAVIGAPPQDLTFSPDRKTKVAIGDENVIREGVTINKGTMSGGGQTVIGNRNMIMGLTHVAHDCII